MIELILYFTLGFLVAAFIAALVMPAVWRRAVRLTRKRIEASIPLTAEEIRAEKDAMRAEYAMETRRLEFDAKELKQKLAEQTIEFAKTRQDVDALTSERSQLKEELTKTEASLRDWRAELRRKEEHLQAVSTALGKTEQSLAALQSEYERLGVKNKELGAEANARQAELLTRGAELEGLKSDYAALRGQWRNSEKLAEGGRSELGAAQRAVLHHKLRAEQLEARVQTMIADISDRDERLERRDREVARLRDRLKPVSPMPGNDGADLRMVDLQRENLRLEAEIVSLKDSQSQAADIAGPVDASARSLEAKFAMLARENKRLREQHKDRSERPEETHMLREQMLNLAAEVVAMTASLEGPGSPIDKALAAPGPANAPKGAGVSLADRIRALQKRALSRQ